MPYFESQPSLVNRLVSHVRVGPSTQRCPTAPVDVF
eukprot:COSAG06_NODE_52292_length_306_cov_1.473430_2_plen_35_part_01